VSFNIKVIHLLCACLFLGNVIVSGVWAALAERTGSHEVIKFSNRLVLLTDVMFTATGALGVVITGHLMADRYGGDTAHGWITWSYMLFGLSGLIWAFILVPIQLRQRTLLARFDYITADYMRLSMVWKIAGAIATLLPLPIIYLMVTKVA
jgi:uncharacterized membrane protein